MSATPHRFRYADAGGSSSLPVARPMLPIRQHLKTTALKPGPKAVLMEVCELYENGKKGACFISNTELAKNLGISLATATRTINTLVAGGLLVSQVVAAEANRRYLTPTAVVRACYTGGIAASQLLAASNLAIVKNDALTELTIVKSESDYSQNSEVTIVKNNVDYSQNASRVLGDKQDKQVDKQTEEKAHALASALAAAEKKIQQLEAEKKELAEELAQVAHQRNQLRASVLAQRPAPHTGPFSACRFATPEGFAQLARDLRFTTIFIPHYLAAMLVKATGEPDRDEKGWQNYIQSWLTREAKRNELVTSDPNLQTSAYGTATFQPGSTGARNPRPSGRLDVEAAVAVAGAFASLRAPIGPDGPAERHDGGDA